MCPLKDILIGSGLLSHKAVFRKENVDAREKPKFMLIFLLRTES